MIGLGWVMIIMTPKTSLIPLAGPDLQPSGPAELGPLRPSSTVMALIGPARRPRRGGARCPWGLLRRARDSRSAFKFYSDFVS